MALRQKRFDITGIAGIRPICRIFCDPDVGGRPDGGVFETSETQNILHFGHILHIGQLTYFSLRKRFFL